MNLLPHNIKPYREICKAFQQHSTVLFVSGTGTGKSYVTKEIIESNFKSANILYVVPRKAMIDYMKIDAGFNAYNNVTYVTYDFFLNYDEAYSRVRENELVILDEAHHLGADISGNNLLRIMSNTRCKYLGLTATPLRDDGVNVSKFFGKTVKGLTHFDAIKLGLMPKFSYLICSPKLDELSEDERRRYRINFESSSALLADMITHATCNKWLVFCSNIEQAEASEALVKSLFPEHKVVLLHSKTDNPENILSYVRREERVVVISCNMLLEGLHLSEVDGILLFRNVQSIVTFQQILGRITTFNTTKCPVVIDATRSAYKVLHKLLRDDCNKNVSNFSSKEFVKSKHTLIDVPLQYVQYYDVMDVLEKVNSKSKIVINENDIFSSQREFIESFGISVKDVYRERRETSDSLEHAIDNVRGKRSFLINGRDYYSATGFCKCYGISLSTLRAIRLRMSYSTYIEAANYWLSVTAIRVNGYYFKDMKQACNCYNVKLKDVEQYSIVNHITKTQALEELAPKFDTPFVFNSISYSSAVDCCLQINVNYAEAVKKSLLRKQSLQETLQSLVEVESKHSRSFSYNGVKYASYAKCLRELKLCRSTIDAIVIKCNVSRSTAIDMFFDRHPDRRNV